MQLTEAAIYMAIIIIALAWASIEMQVPWKEQEIN